MNLKGHRDRRVAASKHADILASSIQRRAAVAMESSSFTSRLPTLVQS